MHDTTDTTDRKMEIRQSPAASHLTESQFDKTWLITEIMAREIHRSETFRDVLSDFAHAAARTERFDTLKAEEIIRDVFKARYGQTMNQMREGLQSRATEVEPSIDGAALRYARSVPCLIQEAPTMPFYRAYDQAAVAMADEFGIGEASAKEVMKAAFRSHEGRELYDAGKEAEEFYHKPVQQQAADTERKSESRVHRQRSRSWA